MARTPKNKLEIVDFDESFRLQGYFRGKRIRKQSRDLSELQAEKARLESLLLPEDSKKHQFRQTWLSEAELRDAEAAILEAEGMSLTKCVRTAKTLETPARLKLLSSAIEEWVIELKRLGRRGPTISKNRIRATSLMSTIGDRFLHEISPAAVKEWVLNPKHSSLTQLSNGAVLRAFFGFAIAEGWMAKSPLTVDMDDLAARARPIERARIVTPEEAWALLRAAERWGDGKMVPYFILSTWCFMRSAEVQRTTISDIHFDSPEPFVEVRPVKRGTVSYRTIEIPPCVSLRLQKSLATLGCEKVPYSLTGHIAIRKEVGVKWQENILRHSGISYRYQQSKNITLVCREAGNSSETAFAHYMNLPNQYQAEAFYRR